MNGRPRRVPFASRNDIENHLPAPIRPSTKSSAIRPSTKQSASTYAVVGKPSTATRPKGISKTVMKNTKVNEPLVPARRPGQDVTNTRKTVSGNKTTNPANNMAKTTSNGGGVAVGVVKTTDPSNTKAAQTATRPGGVAARPSTARPAAAATIPAAPVKAGGARQPSRPKASTQTATAPKRNAAAVSKKAVAKKPNSIYEDIKKKPSPKQDAALEAALEAALAVEREEKKKEAAAKIAAATRPAGPRRMIKKTDPVFSEAFSDIIANAFDSSSSLEEDDGNETETGLPSSDDTYKAVPPSSPAIEDKENSGPATQQVKRRSAEPHPFTSDDETDLLTSEIRTDDLTRTCGFQYSILLPLATAEDQALLDEAHELYSHVVDPEEEDDIRMVSEYSHEIFTYLSRLELELAPNPNYMEHQPELQWSMRSILLDWLIQVHQRLELRPETMFLTVNIIDRFLTVQVVALRKIQLVGITALFIASKYEEVSVPALSEMTYMVDNGYLPQDILDAERHMLTKLNFALGWPGPMSFLRKISKADDYDVDTRTLAKYFCEVAIMDERFVGVPPSVIAAGAEGLARIMLEKGPWTLAHVAYSNYTATQLREVVRTLLECTENPRKHHAAVYEKFRGKMYYDAAGFVAKWWRKNGDVGDVSEFLFE